MGWYSLPRKTLDVVLACGDGTLLGTLGLVREHVGLEVLEGLAAVGVRAALLFPRLIAAILLLPGVIGLIRHQAPAPLRVDGRLEWRVGRVITIMQKRRGAAGAELRRRRDREGWRGGIPGVGGRRV